MRECVRLCVRVRPHVCVTCYLEKLVTLTLWPIHQARFIHCKMLVNQPANFVYKCVYKYYNVRSWFCVYYSATQVVGWATNEIIISSKPNDWVFVVLNKAFDPMKETNYTKQHGRVIVSQKCLTLLQQWRLNIEIAPYVINPFIAVHLLQSSRHIQCMGKLFIWMRRMGRRSGQFLILHIFNLTLACRS